MRAAQAHRQTKTVSSCGGEARKGATGRRGRPQEMNLHTKIIEASIEGLWLKILVATLEPHEIARPSALPYYVENSPDRPLLTLERKTRPSDVWILDLSTREGRAFTLDEGIEYEMATVTANL